jgi:Spy/CpxP family protein refolding chaperone
MKSKTIVIILLVLLGAVGIAALGQSVANHVPWHGHGAGDFINWKVSRLTRHLNLTDTQQQQVKSLMESQKPVVQPMFQQLMAQQQQMIAATQNGQFDQAKVQAIASQQAQVIANLIVVKEQTHSRIYALLTPDQRIKFDEMRQKRIEHMQKWASAQSPAPPAPSE